MKRFEVQAPLGDWNPLSLRNLEQDITKVSNLAWSWSDSTQVSYSCPKITNSVTANPTSRIERYESVWFAHQIFPWLLEFMMLASKTLYTFQTLLKIEVSQFSSADKFEYSNSSTPIRVLYWVWWLSGLGNWMLFKRLWLELYHDHCKLSSWRNFENDTIYGTWHQVK